MTEPTSKKTIAAHIASNFMDFYIGAIILLAFHLENTITIHSDFLIAACRVIIHAGFVVFVGGAFLFIAMYFKDKETLKRAVPEGYGIFWLTAFLLYANVIAGYTVYGIIIGALVATIAYLRFWRTT